MGINQQQAVREITRLLSKTPGTGVDSPTIAKHIKDRFDVSVKEAFEATLGAIDAMNQQHLLVNVSPSKSRQVWMLAAHQKDLAEYEYLLATEAEKIGNPQRLYFAEFAPQIGQSVTQAVEGVGSSTVTHDIGWAEQMAEGLFWQRHKAELVIAVAEQIPGNLVAQYQYRVLPCWVYVIVFDPAIETVKTAIQSLGLEVEWLLPNLFKMPHSWEAKSHFNCLNSKLVEESDLPSDELFLERSPLGVYGVETIPGTMSMTNPLSGCCDDWVDKDLPLSEAISEAPQRVAWVQHQWSANPFESSDVVQKMHQAQENWEIY